jgi:hypothetical protein
MSISTGRIQCLVNQFEIDIQAACKELGTEAFASRIKVEIQDVSLGVFHALTQDQNVKMKMYDVSEGIPCLETVIKAGSYGHIHISSNPILDRAEEEEDET